MRTSGAYMAGVQREQQRRTPGHDARKQRCAVVLGAVGGEQRQSGGEISPGDDAHQVFKGFEERSQRLQDREGGEARRARAQAAERVECFDGHDICASESARVSDRSIDNNIKQHQE